MSGERGSCLVSPDELLERVSINRKLNKTELTKALKSLELEDFFDIVYANAGKSEMYCISLHQKGRTYFFELRKNKRYILFKVCIAAFSALITFVVGRLLYLLFS